MVRSLNALFESGTDLRLFIGVFDPNMQNNAQAQRRQAVVVFGRYNFSFLVLRSRKSTK